MKQHQRIFGLDIVRTIAIISVLVMHMWTIIPNTAPKLLHACLSFDGVSIFFVLSGYLIGHIIFKILKEKGASFSNLTSFWRDRWLRTLPAYYCVLIGLMAILIYYTHKTFHHFIYLFFFSENISGNSSYDLFTESWSLAVEEWFYLLIPILLFLAVRIWSLKKAVPIIIVSIVLFSTAVRFYRTYKYGILTAGPDTHILILSKLLTSVPAKIDNIMFGILGAYLSFFRFSIWTNYKNLLFAIGITGFLCNHFYKVFSGINFYTILLHTQVQLLFILMTFPKLSTITAGNGPIARFITFTSAISYSIYLIHMSIFIVAVMPRFPLNTWVLIPVYYLWAFGGGYLLHITIEKWGLQLRDKLRTQKSLRN